MVGDKRRDWDVQRQHERKFHFHSPDRRWPRRVAMDDFSFTLYCLPMPSDYYGHGRRSAWVTVVRRRWTICSGGDPGNNDLQGAPAAERLATSGNPSWGLGADDQRYR